MYTWRSTCQFFSRHMGCHNKIDSTLTNFNLTTNPRESDNIKRDSSFTCLKPSSVCFRKRLSMFVCFVVTVYVYTSSKVDVCERAHCIKISPLDCGRRIHTSDESFRCVQIIPEGVRCSTLTVCGSESSWRLVPAPHRKQPSSCCRTACSLREISHLGGKGWKIEGQRSIKTRVVRWWSTVSAFLSPRILIGFCLIAFLPSAKLFFLRAVDQKSLRCWILTWYSFCTVFLFDCI